MRKIFALAIFNTILFTLFVKGEDDSPFSRCTNRLTCTDCIRTSGCSWCSQKEFYGADKQAFARCNTTQGHEGLGRFQCEKSFFYPPDNNVMIIRNDDITKKGNNNGDEAVSLKPQEVAIKLRKGVPVKLELEYEDPKDYPLDMYYLMDLTHTMNDDKESLSNLGDALVKKLRSLTPLFRQGFGSFIDKVTMPYIRLTPEWLKNSCLNKDNCTTPYGFRHHLSLSDRVGEFSAKVKEAKLSGSIDKPEGGLDALMQAMVCREIGWRNKSRKVVIFATDAPFHIALDGKLGGIIRPNDGKCHLANGEYTHSTEMDYPSIAQLSYTASENSVIVIFAVTDEQLPIYTKLAKKIEGAKSALLSNDSSNVVDLVVEEYKNIASRVEMRDNFLKQYVNVKYFSKCMNNDGAENETNVCEGLHVDSRIKFSIQIELIECPSNADYWKQKHKISPVGLPDGLIIDLEMLCDCACENEENWVHKSPKCGGNGAEKCGLCECYKPFFGKVCECSATDDTMLEDELQSCRKDNSTEICSGRGVCHCGQCECDRRDSSNQKYSGMYCECDNFSCPQENGEMCSGHGTCDCGQCQCSPNWSGEACFCSSDQSSCKKPGSDELEVCDGNGECQCGKCKCTGKYTGDFCEKCLDQSCPTRCEQLSHCVQCKVYGTGLFGTVDECDQNCSTHNITVVNVISHDTSSNEEEVLCRAEDATDQCSFYFVYGQAAKGSTVFIDAQKGKECPPTPPIYWILLAIIALIVIGGLCLIIAWKLCTLYADKKEFAKFENERMNASFPRNDNPLYQNPVGTYENPMYGKQLK